MKVDRESFLVLVATLAAGCRDVGPPPAAPDPSEAPVRWSPASSTADDYAARPRPRPAPQAEGSNVAPLGSNAKEGSEQGASDPYAAKIVGERCNPELNLHGFPRSCAFLTPPGPTCEGFDSLKDVCAGLEKRLKPRVAAKAIDCVLEKNKTEELCSNVTGLCAIQSLTSACVELAATPVCTEMVKDCTERQKQDLAQSTCEAAWSALRPSARPKFIACMTEVCSMGACFP